MERKRHLFFSYLLHTAGTPALKNCPQFWKCSTDTLDNCICKNFEVRMLSFRAGDTILLVHSIYLRSFNSILWIFLLPLFFKVDSEVKWDQFMLYPLTSYWRAVKDLPHERINLNENPPAVPFCHSSTVLRFSSQSDLWNNLPVVAVCRLCLLTKSRFHTTAVPLYPVHNELVVGSLPKSEPAVIWHSSCECL